MNVLWNNINKKEIIEKSITNINIINKMKKIINNESIGKDYYFKLYDDTFIIIYKNQEYKQ